MLGAVLVQQQFLRVVLGHVGIGLRRQRSPPKLGTKALCVDLVHQRLHVAVAIGKLRRQQRPIAFVRLPSVIHAHPREAQLLDFRQGLFHL